MVPHPERQLFWDFPVSFFFFFFFLGGGGVKACPELKRLFKWAHLGDSCQDGKPPSSIHDICKFWDTIALSKYTKKRVNLQQNIQWPKQAQILRSLCKQGHRPEKSTGGGVKYQLRQVQMGTCFLQEIKNVRPEQMLQSACLKEGGGKKGVKSYLDNAQMAGFLSDRKRLP